jgi:hypothetical protein
MNQLAFQIALRSDSIVYSIYVVLCFKCYGVLHQCFTGASDSFGLLYSVVFLSPLQKAKNQGLWVLGQRRARTRLALFGAFTT